MSSQVLRTTSSRDCCFEDLILERPVQAISLADETDSSIVHVGYVVANHHLTSKHWRPPE